MIEWCRRIRECEVSKATMIYADVRGMCAFPIPRPPAPTTTDIPAWRRWFASVMGPGVSDDESVI